MAGKSSSKTKQLIMSFLSLRGEKGIPGVGQNVICRERTKSVWESKEKRNPL
jgi:hypothetical protein